MRKIIVDSIQTPQGTSFDIFQSQGSGTIPVIKDSADGIFKNATFPADIEVVHEGATGVAATSFEKSLLRSDNSLKTGYKFDINANDDAWFVAPTNANHRELRFKLKDSSGNFLTGSNTRTQNNFFDNGWSGSDFLDQTVRDYAALRTGYVSHSVYNTAVIVDVAVYNDPTNNSRHFLSLRWRGRVGSSGSSSQTAVIAGQSYCRYDTGTPTTLVIETNASVGNNEEAVYINNLTGYLT